MLNIYSLLIPVRNTDSFWLINTKSFINKTLLSTDPSLAYLSESNTYFFPFNKCTCANHTEEAECIQYICTKVNVNIEKVLGYVFISNRVMDSQSYIFNVLVCQPISIDELNQTSFGFCLYSKNSIDIPLLGPEVLITVNNFMKSYGTDRNMPAPILPSHSLQNLSLNHVLSTLSSSSIIKSIFHESDYPIQKYVYMAFMSHCYPSCEMGRSQFQQFMTKQNMIPKHFPQYFRSFDSTSAGFISFEKFLIAVTCMDFNMVHGGQTGELRCRYIFSFYDDDRDGYLTSSDLRNMIIDINTKKGKSIDEDTINIDHQEATKIFELDAKKTKFDLDKFLNVVGNLLFRGTSVLFRFDSEMSFSNRYGGDNTDSSVTQTTAPNLLAANANGKTESNMDKWDYTLAVHSAKIQNEGDIMIIRPIWDDIPNSEQLGEFGNRLNLNYARLHSVKTFSKDSCPNEILQSLKYFRYSDKISNKRKLSWGDISMELLAKYLHLLCDDVIAIVSKEPKMIEIPSPAYVLGDLHGNFVSLSKFEDVLWRLGIGLSPGKFLFLGDYVDRGKYGIEVVAYLFAQKVLYPNQVYLLRGNHEIRTIQEQYTFKRECIDKFGEASGIYLWNKINDVFDILPIAAVIDSKLFCVHGGIPRSSLISANYSHTDPLLSLRQSINTIPSPMSDPEQVSALAWEIMWSDPDRTHQSVAVDTDLVCSTNSEDFGFSKNQNRKTACWFNEIALANFLSRYHLSHVIRAHEVQQIGFNIEHHAKLVTVFSSADYCQNNNEAACVLVSNRKLRLIRMDTGE